MQIIHIGLLIFLNYIIMNVRLWFAQNIFGLKEQKNLIWMLIIMGLVSSGGLLLYPLIMERLGQSEFVITMLQQGFDFKMTIWLGVYLLGLIAISYISFNRENLQKFLIHVFLFSIIFIMGNIIGYVPGISMMIVYYVIAASSEEILKFFMGYHFSEKYEITSNDIILFAILSGIGFCFIENFVYAFAHNQSLGQSITIIIQRGFINFLMHAVFTGMIGYGLYRSQKIPDSYHISIAIIIMGFILHITYNLSIYFGFLWLTAVFFIGGYFILSYLISKTDSLYITGEIGTSSSQK